MVSIPACDVEIYGSVCSSDCNCVADNTQTGTTECDTISGFCLCLPQWTGYRCDIDVDECKTGEHNCAHVCINMDGGFECECEQGFVKGSRGECFEHTDGKDAVYAFEKPYFILQLVETLFSVQFLRSLRHIYHTLKVKTILVLVFAIGLFSSKCQIPVVLDSFHCINQSNNITFIASQQCVIKLCC